jgi:ADP-ribose diphosphatase
MPVGSIVTLIIKTICGPRPDTMTRKPSVTHSRTLAQTRLFHIEQVDVHFPNGGNVQWERLRSTSPGAVLVVPMLDARTVLLIREYAVAVERYELALPKGRMQVGELSEAAANREIMEEIGYGARRMRLIKSMTLAPGYFSHITHVLLAQDLYAEKRDGDEPEPIEVVPWPLDRLDELCVHPDCTEARSIAALFMVRELLRSEGR